jgi:glycosyltransferase involved in cell wall biosynthesis
MVGNLARWKGQLEFLDALALLRRDGLDFRAQVVGGAIYDTRADRGYERELREKVATLGLGGQVELTGFREDVAAVIRGLDIVVHASNRPEPFGRVIIEGMASGVPVVASAAGGVLEIVEDGRTALLFKPGSAVALAGALRTLLERPGLRRSLARAGREEFLARFTLAEHARRISALYRSILR